MPGLLLNEQPGTPGAISQMLGLLMQQPAAGQPGQPMPAPAAPMPTPAVAMQAQAPSMPTPETHQSLLGKIHDFISDRVGIKEPSGYRGLLSDAEIQSAKPGILAAGAGDSWSNNLNRILQMKAYAQEAAQAAKTQAAREQMGKLFAEPANESHADRMNRIERMYTYAVQNGLPEAAEMGKVVSELAIPQKVAEPAPHTITTRQGIMQWNPATKKYEATGFDAPDRQEPVQIVAAAQPNADGTPGTPTYFRVPKDGGPATPIAGIVPQPGSRAQNAQNMAAEALLRSSVSEMTNADKYMQSYEHDLASGKKSINGLAQFIGGIGNSFTHDDPASRAIQNTALTALNKVNPDLARYIRRGLSFAEGEAGISKRPSDFRTKMAAFLSTAASGASPDMIQDIQGRRQSILNPLHEVLADHPTGGGVSKPRLTQAQYDTGRKKGHSAAEIATHYDLSGVSRK